MSVVSVTNIRYDNDELGGYRLMVVMVVMVVLVAMVVLVGISMLIAPRTDRPVDGFCSAS